MVFLPLSILCFQLLVYIRHKLQKMKDKYLCKCLAQMYMISILTLQKLYQNHMLNFLSCMEITKKNHSLLKVISKNQKTNYANLQIVL